MIGIAPVSTFVKPVRSEVPAFLYQDSDMEWLSSLVPRWLPGREDVIQNTFVDLFARAVTREEVPARIRALITEHKRQFPTHSFGDVRSPLSLDAAAFRDGTTTIAETVSQRLWD